MPDGGCPGMATSSAPRRSMSTPPRRPSDPQYEREPPMTDAARVTEPEGSPRGGLEELSALDRAHVLHPHQTVGRPADPLVVARARGATIWDADGNEYIDGTW